jgi:hypothetical protein
MASVLDMLGRLTDQGICLADLHPGDMCAYSVADGVHVMLRGWLRAHAMGLGKEYAAAAAAAHAVSPDPAVADATYLDSIDWVAESDCQCCDGGHTRRAGVMFKQWLQELREVEGVVQWIPHAHAILQVTLPFLPHLTPLTPFASRQRVTGEGLDPAWPALRSTDTIRGLLYYSNPASTKPDTYDAAFGNLFKAWASYDEGRKQFPDNGVFPNNLGSVCVCLN